MCRIATIISENKLTLPSRIEAMTKAMQHGGPDDAGHYIDDVLPVAMGHRRLSIIDLSPSGHQPMLDESKKIIISFNGEIYNYLELRNELKNAGYTFSSQSDTEVIIQGYKAWGTDLFSKLKGMFAFVIFDKINNQLIAVRDHAGIKPLYYAKKGGDFYCSSEVRALLAIDEGWTPYEGWPIWFLTFGYIPEPFTTLQNVWQLPKGNYLTYNLKSFTYTIHPYNVNNKAEPIYKAEAAIAQTKKTVIDAVKRHLIADVPVGVFLSGGIDSSILTIIAQQLQHQQLQTLSIYFEDDDYSEKKYQDIIIAKTGVKHSSYQITQQEFEASLPDIYKAMDQPSTDGINTYFITKYAKAAGLKVVLSGLGADELFGGYPSFQRSNKIQYLLKMRMAAAFVGYFASGYPLRKLGFLRTNKWYNDFFLFRGLFSSYDAAKILEISVDEVEKELQKLPRINELQQAHPLNRVSILESGIYMQNQLLRDSDIYSMWHSVELRVPFLDKDLIELVERVEPQIKFNPVQKKYLLIEAFKNELPQAIWNRPKQGFVFPFEQWFSKMPVFSNEWHMPKYWQKKFEKKQINYTRIWAIFLSRVYGNTLLPAMTSAPNQSDTAFIYLDAFSKTGGIQQVNKNLLKVFDIIYKQTNKITQVISLCDGVIDTKYYSRSFFKVFNNHKLSFLWHLLWHKPLFNHIIIAHINLAPAAQLLAWKKPGLRITLLTHGIEVWKPLHGSKKKLLNRSNTIIAVSEFTKKKLIEQNGIEANKIKVVTNCLDPYFKPATLNYSPVYLQKRYGIAATEPVLLTIARLSNQEQYKGYDDVLESLVQVKKHFPNIKYLLCGKADPQELKRVQHIIKTLGITNNVILTGHIAQDELIDHYALANLFVMPSRGEGFGIVFIEAAANGLYNIAANGDASEEALLQGALGKLVNVEDIHSLAVLIINSLQKKHSAKQQQDLCLQHYSFEEYNQKIQIALAG